MPVTAPTSVATPFPAAESGENREDMAQHGGEADELPGRGSCGVAVIQHRQQVHQHGGAGRAEEDEGHPAADFGARAVGERAEQRQQEKRQNVVQRHDRAGDRLIQAERFGQDLGDDAVVHLPEGTDG